jgi:hypothetical protein
MNEPVPDLLCQAGAQKDRTPGASLWRDAPAWRNLVVGAACLTALAVATPFFDRSSAPAAGELAKESGKTAPEPQSSCPLKPGLLSPAGAGKVVGFMSSEQALDLTQRTEAERQAKLNPAYINNLRVFVRSDGSPMRFIAIVPATMTVKIGDQVEFGGAYRDPSLPCHYMPPLTAKIAGPAAPAGNVAGSQQ